jgi:flagellar protein FliS
LTDKGETMSMLSPAAIYKRQQTTPSIDVDNNHMLIQATMEYLVRSLSVLAEKPEFGSEVFKDHAARALTSIYVLQSSLDFEKGGAIATNLFQLYEYCRLQVLKAMRRDETGNVVQARDAMNEIVDAWQKIA